MTSNTLKRGKRVYFRTRAKEGEGKIVAVRETGRGLWYDVKADAGYTIAVRAAGLGLL